MQLTYHTWAVTPAGTLILPYGHTCILVIEAIAEGGRDDILALANEWRNVVHKVEISLVIVRETRVKPILRYSLAIYLCIVISRSTNIEVCSVDTLCSLKLATEHRCRAVVAIVRIGNPLCLPLIARKIGGGKPSHIGLCHTFALSVKDTHLPAIAAMRAKIGCREGNERFVGYDLYTLRTSQATYRVGNTYLDLMLLKRFILRRGVCPGETNLLGIDGNRLCGIFASHILHLNASAGSLCSHPYADDQHYSHQHVTHHLFVVHIVRYLWFYIRKCKYSNKKAERKTFLPNTHCSAHYPSRRYSFGEIPTRRLKYLPKKVCDEKFNTSLTC